MCLAILAGRNTKEEWWVVEGPENTQSLPAAASGVSESANGEEGSDSEDNPHEEYSNERTLNLII